MCKFTMMEQETFSLHYRAGGGIATCDKSKMLCLLVSMHTLQ